MKKSAKIPLE